MKTYVAFFLSAMIHSVFVLPAVVVGLVAGLVAYGFKMGFYVAQAWLDWYRATDAAYRGDY